MVLGDVRDVERLQGVLHVLGVHVVDLAHVTLSVGRGGGQGGRYDMMKASVPFEKTYVLFLKVQ